MKKLVKCRDGWLWVTLLKKPIKAATNWVVVGPEEPIKAATNWVVVGPEEPINLEWFAKPKKEQ